MSRFAHVISSHLNHESAFRAEDERMGHQNEKGHSFECPGISPTVNILRLAIGSLMGISPVANIRAPSRL